MEPSDCDGADAPLPDLTVSGCIQGEAHLSEMANIGPSARLPLGTRLPLPHSVVPGSLHFQIGGSWTHIGHVSAPDASVRVRPPVNYHLHRRKARRCRDVLVPDGWHCCVIIITLTTASQVESHRSQVSYNEWYRNAEMFGMLSIWRVCSAELYRSAKIVRMEAARQPHGLEKIWVHDGMCPLPGGVTLNINASFTLYHSCTHLILILMKMEQLGWCLFAYCKGFPGQ